MFGMNERVGKAYFGEQRKSNNLLVTSKFYTLQGEGPYRGMPAYFVRLAKCNLACSFCDTYFDKGDELEIGEIISEAVIDIDTFHADLGTPSLNEKERLPIVFVVTGGEPSLQPNLYRLLNVASHVFKHTQIESNGIITADIPDSTTYVVSPKCREKDGEPVAYMKPPQSTLDRADCLKFVMDFHGDTPYNEVPDWVIDWRRATGKEVFVSPMNIYNQEPAKAKEMRASNKEIDIATRSTVDEVISFWEPDLLDLKKNQHNHEKTAEYAMKYGLTLNLQMHLFASLP